MSLEEVVYRSLNPAGLFVDFWLVTDFLLNFLDPHFLSLLFLVLPLLKIRYEKLRLAFSCIGRADCQFLGIVCKGCFS